MDHQGQDEKYEAHNVPSLEGAPEGMRHPRTNTRDFLLERHHSTLLGKRMLDTQMQVLVTTRIDPAYQREHREGVCVSASWTTSDQMV